MRPGECGVGVYRRMIRGDGFEIALLPKEAVCDCGVALGVRWIGVEGDGRFAHRFVDAVERF